MLYLVTDNNQMHWRGKKTMRKLRSILTVFAALVTLTAINSHGAGDPKARDLYGVSPHNDKGDCGYCHVAPREKLESWLTFASTKRQLKEDLNELCRRCHGVGFGHGVGKKPAMNIANLPLSADGTVNCAMTCHDMHVVSADNPGQQYLHLRIPQVKLCLSCHDK